MTSGVDAPAKAVFACKRWARRLSNSTVYHVVRVARAAAAGVPVPGPARGRIRLASGAWLMIRATVLRGRDCKQPRIAVVLERARRAQLATLMVRTYDLSAREREVTELLLRGLPIDAIAADLAISRHTVRDHTKAIFGKRGVTSRPELTAKLYHEHALPEMRFTASSVACASMGAIRTTIIG